MEEPLGLLATGNGNQNDEEGAMTVIDFEPNTFGNPVDIEYIRAVEDEIGVSFPSSFLALIKKYNGGRPIDKYFELNGNEKVVERFLSFIPDYKENAMGIYDVEVVWSQIEDRLNDYLCPFAVLFAGDFLCFDSEGREEPRVVLWDHERSDEDSPVLIEVASNFDDFLKRLHV